MSHNEGWRDGGGADCGAFLACGASPFLGGRVLPAGFVLFLGGVEGLRRGIVRNA